MQSFVLVEVDVGIELFKGITDRCSTSLTVSTLTVTMRPIRRTCIEDHRLGWGR